MINEERIKSLAYSGRRWDIIRINGSYFARCYERSGPSDTGPYSTAEQAEEFITAVQMKGDA